MLGCLLTCGWWLICKPAFLSHFDGPPLSYCFWICSVTSTGIYLTLVPNDLLHHTLFSSVGHTNYFSFLLLLPLYVTVDKRSHQRKYSMSHSSYIVSPFCFRFCLLLQYIQCTKLYHCDYSLDLLLRFRLRCNRGRIFSFLPLCQVISATFLRRTYRLLGQGQGRDAQQYILLVLLLQRKCCRCSSCDNGDGSACWFRRFFSTFRSFFFVLLMMLFVLLP